MTVKNFKINTGLDLNGKVLENTTHLGTEGLYWDNSLLATQSYVDNAISGVTVDPSGWAGSWLDWNAGTNQFDVNIPSGTYAAPADIPSLSGYATETYVGSQGFITSSALSGYATESYVTNQGYITSSALSGYATESYVGNQGFITASTEFVQSASAPLSVNSSGALSLNYLSDHFTVGSSDDLQINTSVIATKAYVDATAQGLDIKASVVSASTENLDLSSIGSMTQVGGIDLFADARYLLKDQTDASQNGIYVFDIGTIQLNRATDATFDTATGTGTLTKGAFVFVEQGTNAGHGYVVSDISVSGGVWNNTWTQFSETGNYITSVSSQLSVTDGELSIGELTDQYLRGMTQINPTDGSQPNTGYGLIQYLNGDTGNERLKISAEHGWTGGNVGGYLELTAHKDVTVNSTTGNIVLNADGASYIGSATSNNEIATHGYVTGLGYITSSDVPANYITSVGSNLSVGNGTGGATLGQLTLGGGVVIVDSTQTLSNKTLSNPTITIGSSSTSTPTYIWPGSYSQTGTTLRIPASSYTDFGVGSFSGVTAVTFTDIFGPDGTYPVTGLDGSYLYVDVSTANITGYSSFLNALQGGGFTGALVTGSASTISATEIGYLDGVTSNIQTQLSSKLTSSDLSGYATESYVGNQGFITSAALSDYVTSSSLSTTLGDYVTATTLSGYNYLTSSDLSGYVTSSSLSTTLGDYVTSTTLAGYGYITAADVPANYITSVDASFAVVDGQLSLSDTITISSVELTDSVNNVTAASDVFGNGSTSTYAMGSNQTVGTIPTGVEVADVFITLKDGSGNSRTSKITVVFTGGEAPTWTEYGIITSGWSATTTVGFDSSKNIVVNVSGITSYSAKGLFTTIK